jgi:hypothetical protein
LDKNEAKHLGPEISETIIPEEALLVVPVEETSDNHLPELPENCQGIIDEDKYEENLVQNVGLDYVLALDSVTSTELPSINSTTFLPEGIGTPTRTRSKTQQKLFPESYSQKELNCINFHGSELLSLDETDQVTSSTGILDNYVFQKDPDETTETFFESVSFMENSSDSLSLSTHQSSLHQKIFSPFKPPDTSPNFPGPPLVTLEKPGLRKPMEKIKKRITSISIRSSEVIFSLLASAEDFTIGQFSPWIIDTWNRKKIKPGFSWNCLGKSEESSPKSLSSVISYPPNLNFVMNSLLLLFYCCLVCSTFGIKQNQIRCLQVWNHTKELGNLSLEPNGFCLLGLDDHFMQNSDCNQRGSSMSLGGHFKQVKTGIQLTEFTESTALVSATRKKHIPEAIDHQNYCIGEATDVLMSTNDQSEQTKYRICSLNHGWTDTRNHRAAGFSVCSKKQEKKIMNKQSIPSKYHISNNRMKGASYTLTFLTNEAEIVWQAWSDRRESISRVFLDRLEEQEAKRTHKQSIPSVQILQAIGDRFKSSKSEGRTIHTLNFSVYNAEVLRQAGVDRRGLISTVSWVRLEDKAGRIAKEIDENPIASAVSRCWSFKRQSWSCIEQRESRKADGGQFGGLFDPGIGHTLDFAEQKSSGWPVMCKRTLSDASRGQLHNIWIGFVYCMEDLTSKLPYRLKEQDKGGESWRCSQDQSQWPLQRKYEKSRSWTVQIYLYQMIRNKKLGGLFSWNLTEEAFNLSHHLSTNCNPVMLAMDTRNLNQLSKQLHGFVQYVSTWNSEESYIKTSDMEEK